MDPVTQSLKHLLAGRTITDIYADSEVVFLTLDDGTLIEFTGEFQFTCQR